MATSLVRSLVALLLALGLAGLAAAAADSDPPARVGRASLVEGDVAYLRDGEWIPLPINWPITTGARLSAAPGARAELRVGSTAVRLASATEVEVVRLDDDAIALRLLHGTVDARVRDGEVAREFSVETSEARATLLEPGRYRFDAGIVPDTTAVSADIGAARVEAGGNSMVVRPGKRAEVWRNGDVLLADVRPDAFDEWALARDRREEASRTARYVSPEMTGYESLAEHGDWREVAEYGPVWVPRAVPAGWAPYRAGRWAWIEPWGWTWIDEAPWGFAPFHYGRWAFIGGAWAWAPGRVVARPVYAPALVGWVGRPGWSVSVSIGTVPAVGWFPLAPREVFVPAYRHSPAYVRNVNIAHVTNVTQITNVTTVNYVNRHLDRAVTVVPAAAVTNGQPIARSQVPVRRAELDRSAPASPTPPVAAIAPPRPVAPHATRDDDRGPHRGFDPSPRPQDARRDAPMQAVQTQPSPNVAPTPSAPVAPQPASPGPRGSERALDRSPPSVNERPAPRTIVVAPTPTPPVQVTPTTPPRAGDGAPPPASDRANPRTPDRPQARAIERGPDGSFRSADPRPEPRREVQRVETPRAIAPAVPAPQPQVRSEPRPSATGSRRVEPPRAIAPAAPAPQPQSGASRATSRDRKPVASSRRAPSRSPRPCRSSRDRPLRHPSCARRHPRPRRRCPRRNLRRSSSVGTAQRSRPGARATARRGTHYRIARRLRLDWSPRFNPHGATPCCGDDHDRQPDGRPAHGHGAGAAGRRTQASRRPNRADRLDRAIQPAGVLVRPGARRMGRGARG